MTKKNRFIYLLIVSMIFLLAACHSKNDVLKNSSQQQNNSHEKQTKNSGNDEQQKKTDEENEAKKTAEKVLNAMLKDEKASFLSISDISYKDFVYKHVIKDFVASQKINFEPENEWTIPINQWEEYTPSQILESYMETKIYTIIPTIQSYDIKNVKIEKDLAVITFQSKGIDVQKINESIDEISNELFEGMEIDKSQLTESEDDGEKIVALFNCLLYTVAFDSKKLSVPLSDSNKEFSLNLVKRDGHFILTKEDYLALLNELFVKKDGENNITESSSLLL